MLIWCSVVLLVPPEVSCEIDAHQNEEPYLHDWEYFNFKHYYSVVLPVVDANGHFMDNVSWPGRVKDCRVFENSELQRRIWNSEVLQHPVCVGDMLGE